MTQPEVQQVVLEKYRRGPDGQVEATPYETVVVDRHDQRTVTRRDEEGA